MRTEQNLSKYFKIKQHGNTVLSDKRSKSCIHSFIGKRKEKQTTTTS